MADDDVVTLVDWLRQRATVGAVGNVVVFTLLAATAASRAAHGVLSPAGLVAVVVGAAVAATSTGWVTGTYEGAEAALKGQVVAVRAASEDELAGRHPWGASLRWAAWAALWSAAGAIVLAAVLRQHSAPFPVLAVALLALAAPAAVAVDLAARAAGAAQGAALRQGAPVPVGLLRRAWRDLAMPVALIQTLVNAGAAWVLFHGAARDGTLTKSGAFADALIFAVILATVFGALGMRWGSVDAAAGRVVAPTGAGGRRHPVGPQALVYAGALMVALTSLAGWVVPSHPSLLRVALLRGVLAGGLTLVACAMGVVRGATNTDPLELDVMRPALAVPAGRPRSPRRRTRRVASIAGAGAVTAMAALTAAPLVAPPVAQASEMDGLGLVAELDALGVRVEYDIPAPASTGSVPQVVGTARRSGGSESANGIAASPSRLDPVVGGKLSNPDGETATGDEIAYPQAECAYPGALADVEFTFPADLRPDAAGTPPLGWSSARCGAGPELELHATATSPDRVSGLGPAVSVGGVVADATAGPSQGVLSATARAEASGVSILSGAVKVANVIASGRSHTNGQAGGAASEANVDLIGVEVAGVRFDLRGDDVVVNGARLPVGGRAATAILRSASAALAPTGCQLTVLDRPAAYPQGFLFGRPEPELGISEDGTLAASMTGGLLVQCEIPEAVGDVIGFNPQRLQVMLGFVYTGVSAREDIGGFGLGNMGAGTDAGGSGEGLAAAVPSLDVPTPSTGAITAGAPAVDSSTPGDHAGATASAPLPERVRLLAANFAAGRPWLWLVALGLWLLLTHRGLERVRRQIDEAVL